MNVNIAVTPADVPVPQVLPELSPPGTAGRELDSAELVNAFVAFSSAAQSLERSYFGLGKEVFRLRKELAEERDLRRRREALAEISALLAHEVRNPLASMELFAGLLAGSSLDEEKQGWIEQVRSALRILSATVNNILEFHSRRTLELAETELNGILRSVEILLAPVADQARMKWTADLADEPLWIHADRQRLEQVFLNLALNAFRFAAQGRVLCVRTRRAFQAAILSFEDKGPGIAPEVLEKIFEARVTTSPGGSGLGLTVAKHIVEQHRGQISVISSPANGTCFQIRLPLAQAKIAGASQ